MHRLPYLYIDSVSNYARKLLFFIFGLDMENDILKHVWIGKTLIRLIVHDLLKSLVYTDSESLGVLNK